jgi:RNA polymerase sigma factor (sigma-70 family)
MAKNGATAFLRMMIRSMTEDPRVRRLTDQELLCRFRTDHDEEAFHALVRRHGSMVLDVCRNVLGNEADAEDAFQATFLVLAEKVAAIRKDASLASWLYGVAYRIAVTVQRNSANRQKHEARRADQPPAESMDDVSWREVRQVLYEELSRVCKCCLDGASAVRQRAAPVAVQHAG